MSENEDFVIRRRRFVVDWRLQTTVTVQLLGVLVGVGLLYTMAVMILPGSERLKQMDGEEVRETLLRANAIYFALGSAILCVIGLLLTHRFAGPALVLKRAIEGMRKGEFYHRLSLRRRDYLKDVAAALAELRHQLVDRQQWVADLSACLEENDLDAAKEIVAKLVADMGTPAAPEESEPESRDEATDEAADADKSSDEAEPQEAEAEAEADGERKSEAATETATTP